MQTSPVTSEQLAASVVAVPPLARQADGAIDSGENRKLIRHIEEGGVTTLLYGGNAVLYHTRPSQYAALLESLREWAGPNTLVIPSVGPAYGLMLDQAQMLREFDFPTAMILPQRDVATSTGVARAVEHFVEASGRPAVLYIKHEGFIEVADVRRLADLGVLSWIKYAIVRDDPADDDYLRALCDEVPSSLIVSGIGEQPAAVHLGAFQLAGFTSGCVCVAPRLSMDFSRALAAGDVDEAERLRQLFEPLERLRNEINPIRVLHAAVELAGLAVTGPLPPLLHEAPRDQLDAIRSAATALLEAENAARSGSGAPS